MTTNQEPVKPKDRLEELEAELLDLRMEWTSDESYPGAAHVLKAFEDKKKELEGYRLALSDLEGLRKTAEALTDYIEEIDESFEYVVFELAHALAKELQGWPKEANQNDPTN